MPVSKVTGFRASDGTFFTDEEAANYYQFGQDLKEWYRNNKLRTECDCCTYIELDYLVEWIQAHPKEVQQILSAVPRRSDLPDCAQEMSDI